MSQISRLTQPLIGLGWLDWVVRPTHEAHFNFSLFWFKAQSLRYRLRSGRFITVECKYAERVDQSALKGLKAFAKAYGQENLIYSYIASRTSRPYPLADQITAVPGSFINDFLS